MSLPPLPNPVIPASELVESSSGVFAALYLREQMQAYGQQCRDQALLEAAALCNGEQWMMSGKKSVDYIAAFNEGCADCEAVIRRLK